MDKFSKQKTAAGDLPVAVCQASTFDERAGAARIMQERDQAYAIKNGHGAERSRGRHCFSILA